MATEVEILSETAHRRALRNSGKKFPKIVLEKSLREMISTSDGAMDLIQKVRVDVEFGQAEVPLLYQPIYDMIPGPFPGRAVQLGENLLQANIIFMEKWEAGEVQFGELSRGVPKFVTLQTYAAAFEYTEDMIEWDSTFELEMLNRSMGRSYNYLLNHLHLSPIITYDYSTGVGSNTTTFDTESNTLDNQHATLQTFRDAYQTAVSASPQRTPSIILASESDRFQIEDALLAPVRDAQGNPLARVPVDTIIYYDGATITVGSKVYTYPGVTPGSCFFVMPKFKAKEFVHHDLRVDATDDTLSRLIESEIVGRARRGLYIDIPNSVQKVDLS
jgi:hypothetical protein